jgi:hypothetical protein
MRRAQQSWVRHRDTPKYKEGDQVWLEGRHLRTNQPMAKLAPKRHGPFKVVQVMSPVNYWLELPTQWSIHDVFHTDLLTPYCEMPTHGANYQRPPPDLVDGVEEYEVERVLDSRRYRRGRKLQYLIAWKGYPDSNNQWVNWDDAEGAEEAIREFKHSNPDREVHIKASIDSPCSLSSHSRISSMTTSPSSTVHWTIDTPENCAAWDAVICSDSYHAPTITYGDNNNVDDATTYNDHRRGRRSPGIASDILDATAPLRDMEESEADLSSRTSPHHGNEGTSGPSILEDSSRCVGGRFHFQSVLTTGEKRALLASLPATLLTQTPPSSSAVKTMKTTISHADDATIPSPTATVAPPCSHHASTLTKKKTTKKPKFPSPKPPTKKISRWRYVSAEEWAERQTREEEFRRIADGCTHLEPHSVRRAVPYPPLLTASSVITDRTTSPLCIPVTSR